MTDQQKVLVSLALVSETCNAALGSLSGRTVSDHTPELPILQQDLQSLLALIDHSTTKVALALKPTSPTYSASLKPLAELSSQVSSLAQCASLFDANVHGITLVHEVVSAVKDVVESIKPFAQTLMNLGSPRRDDEYLVKIGAIHEIIERARAEGGVSKNNVTAVKKKCSQNHASLEDGLKEVEEMIDADSEGADDAFGDDDGWDELGLGSGKKLGKEELERAKAVRTLLRLTAVLHKRIHLDLLSPSWTDTAMNAALDGISQDSTALLVASDDLVFTFYPPQDISAIKSELASFLQKVNCIQTRVEDLQHQMSPPLSEELGNLSLIDSPPRSCLPKPKEDINQWLHTCFSQIHKSSKGLSLSLEQTGST